MLCWEQEEWIIEAVDQKTKKIEVRRTGGLLQVLLDFVTKRLQLLPQWSFLLYCIFIELVESQVKTYRYRIFKTNTHIWWFKSHIDTCLCHFKVVFCKQGSWSALWWTNYATSNDYIVERVFLPSRLLFTPSAFSIVVTQPDGWASNVDTQVCEYNNSRTKFEFWKFKSR